MAKRPKPKKRRAVRPKAKPAKAKRTKVLKDLEPRGKSKDVKGGVVCIPVIAILIGLLTPQPDPPPPPPPPPPKLRRPI